MISELYNIHLEHMIKERKTIVCKRPNLN